MNNRYKSNTDLWEFFIDNAEKRVAKCKMCLRRLNYKNNAKLTMHLKNMHSCSLFKEYFDVKDSDEYGVCKTCKRPVKNLLWFFRYHMRKAHRIEVKISETANKPELARQRKTIKKYVDICIDKKTILRSIIGLIVEDVVSPLLLNTKHMEDILWPTYRALTRKDGRSFRIDIEKIIALLASNMQNDFSNELHCRLLSIKIDSDLDAESNTFCISTQFLKDFKLQNRILGVIQLNDNEQLNGYHITSMLYKFNIDSNQIINAFWNKNKHAVNKQVKNSEYLNEIEILQLYPEILLGNVKVQPYLGNTAHRCLLDILKNPTVFQKFLECRNLTKFTTDVSNNFYELFKLNNLTMPQLDSPWRAGSTYEMMHDLYQARNILFNVKVESFLSSEDQFYCSNEMWSFVEAFCQSTCYLQQLIHTFNNEELHIGDFYVQWLKCKLATKKVFDSSNCNEGESNILSMMLSVVLNAIENTRNQLLNEDRVVACLYLDPRLTRALNMDQISRAVHYLQKMWHHAKLYCLDNSETSQTESHLLDEDEFLSDDIQILDNHNSEIYRKIARLKLPFQLVDTSVLSYWETKKTSDPEVYNLSSICFAIPATEVSNKTQYSHVYQLDVDSRLPVLMQENLFILRINVHLLDEVLMKTGLAYNRRINEFYDKSEDTIEHVGIFYRDINS